MRPTGAPRACLFFSKRDDEATELLEFRLREMYQRLPDWMRETPLAKDATHEIEVPNGSRVKAFATTGGRSYAATMAVIDEADYVPDLARMLNAVKPTIDAGGQLILMSTSDKSQPESPFKRLYRAAVEGKNGYHPIFRGWQAAPWRTQEWYDQEAHSQLAQTGTLDNLHQEYPATDTEALAPNSLDKRIPYPWLQQCYRPDPERFVIGALFCRCLRSHSPTFSFRRFRHLCHLRHPISGCRVPARPHPNFRPGFSNDANRRRARLPMTQTSRSSFAVTQVPR
jgi:hypothetical protein